MDVQFSHSNRRCIPSTWPRVSGKRGLFWPTITQSILMQQKWQKFLQMQALVRHAWSLARNHVRRTVRTNDAGTLRVSQSSFLVWFLNGPSALVDVGKGHIRSCPCRRRPHVFLFSLLFCDILIFFRLSWFIMWGGDNGVPVFLCLHACSCVSVCVSVCVFLCVCVKQFAVEFCSL